MTDFVAKFLPADAAMPDGDAIGSAASSATPSGRPNLCSVVWPRMKVVARTQQFHFFEPTLVLVLSGRLEFSNEETTAVMTPYSHVAVADQHVLADFTKHPQSDTVPFRSLFLTFSAELITRFTQTFSDASHDAIPGGKKTLLLSNPPLIAALQALIASLSDASLSDKRVTLRAFDLLLVLKEQGFQFSPASSPLISCRLIRILNAAPEENWTAERAGQRLAMSESTLRRKLKNEETGFEQILLETRMHHALMLVQTTRWNLVQIADACGYKSVARFSERFKERFGSTPGRFR